MFSRTLVLGMCVGVCTAFLGLQSSIRQQTITYPRVGVHTRATMILERSNKNLGLGLGLGLKLSGLEQLQHRYTHVVASVPKLKDAVAPSLITNDLLQKIGMGVGVCGLAFVSIKGVVGFIQELSAGKSTTIPKASPRSSRQRVKRRSESLSQTDLDAIMAQVEKVSSTIPKHVPSRPAQAQADTLETKATTSKHETQDAESSTKLQPTPSTNPNPNPNPNLNPTISDPSPKTSSTPVPQKKGNFLGNLFKKAPGMDRLTNLDDVLAADEASTLRVFKAAVTKTLMKFIPQDLYTNMRAYAKPTQDEDAASTLRAIASDAGLESEVTAEAFASVCNAMLCGMVDRAVNMYSGKQENDDAALQSLNDVMQFMDGAAKIFEKTVNLTEVAVVPVKYNGKSARGKIEKLYGLYASRALMGMDEKYSPQQLGLLQQVLSISDGRAESISRKAMMDSVMDMFRKGKDGEGNMEEMLKGLMGSGPGAEGDPLAGLDMNDLPPLDPGQMDQYINEFKQMLDTNSIGEQEIDELYNTLQKMGIDVDAMFNDADQYERMLPPQGKELLKLMKRALQTRR